MFFASFLKLTLDYHTAWFFTEFFVLNFMVISLVITSSLVSLTYFVSTFLFSCLHWSLNLAVVEGFVGDILVRIWFYQLIYMSCNASYVRL